MASDRAHADHAHEHPQWATYKWVALWLTLITIVEVWAYYIPSLVASPLFNPALLFMSAVKFIIVVAFYMHLRYDNKLFTWLFTGCLAIAMATVLALITVFRYTRGLEGTGALS